VILPPNKITPVNPALASRFDSLPFVGRVTEFRRSAMHSNQNLTRRHEATKRVDGSRCFTVTWDSEYASGGPLANSSLSFVSSCLRVSPLPFSIDLDLFPDARTIHFSQPPLAAAVSYPYYSTRPRLRSHPSSAAVAEFERSGALTP
jgi:hypothetical protein